MTSLLLLAACASSQQAGPAGTPGTSTSAAHRVPVVDIDGLVAVDPAW